MHVCARVFINEGVRYIECTIGGQIAMCMCMRV